jgi:two-component system, OmpR family, phosphate regulon sensor histidine kinase PhoR
MKTFGISIVARIFIGYVVIIVFLSAAILFFSFQATRRHYVKNLTGELENLGLVLRVDLAPLLEAGEYGELDALVKELGEETQTRITVITPDGVVRADSRTDPAGMENHADRPEIARALEGLRGRSRRYSATLHEEMLYLAVPVAAGEEPLGVVRLSLFLKDINLLLASLKRSILLPMTGLVIAASILAALLISWAQVRPIMSLAEAARKVGAGDYDVEVSIPANGELRELQDSFNLMTARVRESFAEISRQKEFLGRVIALIREGLMVIDREGRITFRNRGLEEVCGLVTVPGTPYRDAIGDPILLGFIERCRKEKSGGAVEVSFGADPYWARASYDRERDVLVVVFHDLAEMKKLEEMKKKFLVDISHEMRTPLTAIRGFTETLREEAGPEEEKHLEIIAGHTDRLMRIVDDLLLLSRLEEAGTLNPEPLDLAGLVRRTFESFKPRLEAKGLETRLEGADREIGIEADPEKLERVLVNLIDNAVNHTEAGSITCRIRREGDRAVFSIEDTGSGIAPAHLPRIFERFYVADRSRARKPGGTGLGLAIVREIVILHGGTINIESTPGEGTRVSVSLPLRDA